MGAWIIGGAIIGFLIGLFSGDVTIINGVIGCVVFAVVIRKWIFRNLWM